MYNWEQPRAEIPRVNMYLGIQSGWHPGYGELTVLWVQDGVIYLSEERHANANSDTPLLKE